MSLSPYEERARQAASRKLGRSLMDLLKTSGPEQANNVIREISVP